MPSLGVELEDGLTDVASDGDSNSAPNLDIDWFAAQSAQDFLRGFPGLDDPLEGFRERVGATDRKTIDLTAIPDVDVPPSDPFFGDDDDPEATFQRSSWSSDAHLITDAACLQMVLSVLPAISVNYVLKLIHEKTVDATRTVSHCEQLIAELLEGDAYPKEADEAHGKKRKREDDDGLSIYENGQRDPEINDYEKEALALLKDEFLRVPVRHLTKILKEQKTLFKAFVVLEEQVRNYEEVAILFSKNSKARNKYGAEHMCIERGSQLPKELHAAKKKCEIEASKRRKTHEAKEAEEANYKDAHLHNQMGECACCFNDVPLNRMISCNGDTVHFYCMDCPRRQIETEMGQYRCRPRCFGVEDCTGMFSRSQLQQVLGEKTFERLEHMQQMEDLKAAGLDFLSECPFCDFKMECPPVEIDREFRCQNSKCGRTSCRLCEQESHIPLTCKEAKKDEQITLRHVVEEAMSEALIRHCNQCKHPFVKETGCNKMTCTHCRNVQCYVCSKDVTNYEHFGEAQRGKCPLHENVEDRHEQEVKTAADKAMARVRADNPGVSDSDLMIKVSDQVKQAENARKGQAAAQANAFAFHMVGNRLHHRMPVIGGQAPVPRPPPPHPHHPPMPFFRQAAIPYGHPHPAPMLAHVPPHPPVHLGGPVGYPGRPPMPQPYAPGPFQAFMNMPPGPPGRRDGDFMHAQVDAQRLPVPGQMERHAELPHQQREEDVRQESARHARRIADIDQRIRDLDNRNRELLRERYARYGRDLGRR